jgi:hypothetical protein
VKFTFGEDDSLKVPFNLRANYIFEGAICKFLCKFELDKAMLAKKASASQKGSLA